MDVLSKAIDTLKFKIPRQILEAVFIKRDGNWRQSQYNVDENIMAAVIRPRVLVDCNLVGGAEVFIPLAGVEQERVNDYTSVYHIPKSKTQGRSILSVSNITFTDPTRLSSMGIGALNGNTAMLRAANTMVDAMGNIPVTSTARVQLIAENVVMVQDTIVLPANIYLRCTIANDENMSHIQPRSYLVISKLVEYAVKAHIYNELVIEMGMTRLYGGQDLNVFKDIVDGYADSNELYETHLREVVTKVQFMNDSTTYTRFLKSIIGGGR